MSNGDSPCAMGTVPIVQKKRNFAGNMRIALVQNAPELGKSDENLRKLDALIGSGCASDIYVMPEMFATGQSNEPQDIAQAMDGQVISWMKVKAGMLDAAVVGSLPVLEGGKYWNRLCFVMPDGSVTCYDKRHLFTYAGEAQHFTRGTDRVVVSFRGLRILLQVCYDLRFPVFSRNRDDYDAVIYIAAWPEKRVFAWDTLLRARALENQCFAIGVNRCGTDQFGFYPGHSAIIGPYGDTLVETDENAQMVFHDLDLDLLARFRAKFPVLQDAD